MSETPVEKLEGRELDAAVAEEVFGFRRIPAYHGGCWLLVPATFKDYDIPEDPCRDWRRYVPQYCDNMKDAWKVVKLMQYKRARYLNLARMTHPWHNKWRASFKIGKQVLGQEPGAVAVVEGKTASVAICQAALKAVREEKNDA